MAHQEQMRAPGQRQQPLGEARGQAALPKKRAVGKACIGKRSILRRTCTHPMAGTHAPGTSANTNTKSNSYETHGGGQSAGPRGLPRGRLADLGGGGTTHCPVSANSLPSRTPPPQHCPTRKPAYIGATPAHFNTKVARGSASTGYTSGQPRQTGRTRPGSTPAYGHQHHTTLLAYPPHRPQPLPPQPHHPHGSPLPTLPKRVRASER